VVQFIVWYIEAKRKQSSKQKIPGGLNCSRNFGTVTATACHLTDIQQCNYLCTVLEYKQ
jgi:hypothetical protein